MKAPSAPASEPLSGSRIAPPRKPHSRRLAGVAQLLASVAVLWLTLSLFDVRAVFERFRALRTAFIAFAVVIVWLQFTLMGARWWFIAKRLGVALSYLRAVQEYALSALLNQLLPGGVAGDALRGFRHRGKLGQDAPPARAGTRVVLALVLDRMSGQVALFLCALAATPSFWPLMTFGTTARVAALVVPFALALCAAIALSVARRRLWFGRLRDVWEDGGRALFRGRNLATHLGISFALVVSHGVLFWTVARSMHISLAVENAVRIVPLLMLVSSLPAFFAGWGIREAAAAALFHLTGGKAADGASISLVYGAVALLASIPGLWAVRADRASKAQAK